jgi:hypothetical protein
LEAMPTRHNIIVGIGGIDFPSQVENKNGGR